MGVGLGLGEGVVVWVGLGEGLRVGLGSGVGVTDAVIEAVGVGLVKKARAGYLVTSQAKATTRMQIRLIAQNIPTKRDRRRFDLRVGRGAGIVYLLACACRRSQSRAMFAAQRWALSGCPP